MKPDNNKNYFFETTIGMCSFKNEAYYFFAKTVKTLVSYPVLEKMLFK